MNEISSSGRKLFACYQPRFLAFSFAGGLAVIGLALWSKRFEPGSAARLALAGAERAVGGACIVTSVMLLRRLDELQQRIQFESIAIAFGLTGAIVTGWSFVSKAGAPAVDWGAWAYPPMVVLWVAALAFVRRRYA